MKAFLHSSADRRSPKADSSTIAIGTATFVVVLAAAMGLALDRPAPTPRDIGAGWHLRGAFSAFGPQTGHV